MIEITTACVLIARKEESNESQAQTLWWLATPGDGADRARVVAPGTKSLGISLKYYRYLQLPGWFRIPL